MSQQLLQLTPMDALQNAAECLRILAHPHRLRILQMLSQGQFTVGQLASACDLSSPMTSEHLRLMQRCGFLTFDKQGRNVYYSITEAHLKNILDCIESRFGVESTAV